LKISLAPSAIVCQQAAGLFIEWMMKTITCVAAVIAAKLGHLQADALHVALKVEFWAALLRPGPNDVR
jgi:hypothetical protein